MHEVWYLFKNGFKFRRMERKINLLSLLCIILILVDEIFAAAPVITNLPSTVSVGEAETADRNIFTLTTTDADGDSVSCSVQSSTPASAPFRTLVDTNTQKYGVYSHSATFNHGTTPTYSLTIRCTDGTNNVDAVLTVTVIDNDKLDITNLPATETRDASTTTGGTTIFTCTHSDTFGHTTITYTMTSIPASSSFTISSAGVVTTAQALNLETNSQILLYITVSDSLISLTKILTVQLANVNNIPHFSNLPNTVSVSESAASGYVFYTLTPTDLDAGATLSYTMNVQPATHAGYISLNTLTNQVSLVTGFNYEDVNYFNLTFTITDGLASNTEILNVNIVNEHEGCYFHQSIYYLTTVEGAAGSNSLNPGFVIQDYDGTTTWTLEFLPGNNSERFAIANTGLISFAVNYNIDGSAMASTVILTVKCVDTTGQTGTTKVQITVGDVNDNPPVFGQTTYTVSFDQFTSAGSLLGSLVPTDGDYDATTNGRPTCTGTQTTAITSAYYAIGSDCGVYLQTSPVGSLDYGTIATYVVTAVDKGTPALTGTTTVHIIFKETATTTTTTTTTTIATNWFDDSTNVALFSLLLILGLLLLALLLYFCLRCCFTGACCGPDPFDFCNCCQNDCCRPRTPIHHRRTVSPRAREPAKGGPDDNYWGKDREDNDYDTFKNQDIKRGRESVRYPIGKREYPDFPVSSPARLTPTDIAPRIHGNGRPLPSIGYY